ncbi:MAG: DUF5979 domain-containing protein [Clostridiales bacterium]|nr:DUF5979 domain-containing protein [Clostridiales bacterium]
MSSDQIGETIEIAAGGHYTYEGLTYGDYTIEEVSNETEYTLEYRIIDNPGEGKPEDWRNIEGSSWPFIEYQYGKNNHSFFVEFKKTPLKGDGKITFEKRVSSGGGSGTFNFTLLYSSNNKDYSPFNLSGQNLTSTGGEGDFNLYASDMNDNRSAINFSGLPHGYYKITETSPGYTVSYSYGGTEGDIADNNWPAILVNSSVPQNIVYTNTPIPVIGGELTVTKNVEGMSDGNSFSFSLTKTGGSDDGDFIPKTFTLGDKESITIEGLAAGEYLLTEAGSGADKVEWTIEKDGTDITDVVPGAEMTFMIKSDNDNFEINVINTYDPPPQTYTLDISKEARFQNVYPEVSPDTEYDFSVSLADTENKGLDFSAVSAVKVESGEVVPPDNNSNGTFWRFTLKHGQTVTFSGIPQGAAYTATEAPGDYSAAVRRQILEGWEAAGENATSYTGMDADQRLMFINTYSDPIKTGSLSIANFVTGTGADKTKGFVFTAAFEGGGPLEGILLNGIPFDSGTITLKDGESADFTNIPAGSQYRITWRDYSGEGYFTSYSAPAEGVIGETPINIVFENAYRANPVTVILSGDKILRGETIEGLEDRVFTFRVTEGGRVSASGTAEIAETGARTAIGFTGITYYEPGLRTYAVSEDTGPNDNITYDQRAFTVTVNVTDNGRGRLEAEITYPEAGIVFENVYTPQFAEGHMELEAAINFVNGALEEDAFRFEVLRDGVVEGVFYNDENGVIALRLGFTEQDAAGPQPVVYTIRSAQVMARVLRGGGVEYDPVEYTVKVYLSLAKNPDTGETVINVDSYEISTEEGPVEPGGIVFNHRKPKPVTFTISGRKELVGGTLSDGLFSFKLIGADMETVYATAANTGGMFEFPPITYEEQGEYAYIVEEAPRNMPYITYDPARFNVIVSVTENDGELTVSASYPQGEIVFVNTYNPPPAEPPTGEPPTEPPTGEPPTGEPPTGEPPTGEPPTEPPTGEPPPGEPPTEPPTDEPPSEPSTEPPVTEPPATAMPPSNPLPSAAIPSPSSPSAASSVHPPLPIVTPYRNPNRIAAEPTAEPPASIDITDAGPPVPTPYRRPTPTPIPEEALVEPPIEILTEQELEPLYPPEPTEEAVPEAEEEPLLSMPVTGENHPLMLIPCLGLLLLAAGLLLRRRNKGSE